MPRFTRFVFALLVGLGLAIAALSVASARLGPTVTGLSTAHELDGTSVNTAVQLSFSEPMKIPTVQANFHISPSVRGTFNWSGSQLVFTPKRQLQYQRTYTVTVHQAAEGQSGKRLYKSFRGTFTTQSRHLMYLGTAGDEKGELVLASTTGRRQVVGPTDGLVTDYSLSFDRSLVAYVRRSRGGGFADEIWTLNIADGTENRLFSHPGWNISAPHFSPDNRWMVFLATNVRLCQRYYGCTVDKTGPVIFLLDLRTHRVSRFQPHANAPLTFFIAFSPTGQVAYTDLGSALTVASVNGKGVLHVPDEGNSPTFAGFDPSGAKAAFVGQTPSSSGGDILVYDHSKYLDVSRGVYDSATPAFSNSGKRLAYAGYHTELGIEPVYGINIYSFSSRTTTRVTNERRWSDWAPAWSLDDHYIAFLRTSPREAMYMGSGAVWVARANGTGARPIGGTGTNLQWVS